MWSIQGGNAQRAELESIHPPDMANELYKLTGSWVKITSKIEGGMA
jgi:hypothetical protein